MSDRQPSRPGRGVLVTLVVAGLLAGAVVLARQAGEPLAATAPRTGPVEFVEANQLPLDRDHIGIVTILMKSEAREDVLLDLTGVTADEFVDVTLLGVTDCRTLCLFAESFAPGTDVAAHVNVNSPRSVLLTPGDSIWVAFAMRFVGPTDGSICGRVYDVQASTATGARLTIGSFRDGAAIAAIHPRTAGPKPHCLTVSPSS